MRVQAKLCGRRRATNEVMDWVEWETGTVFDTQCSERKAFHGVGKDRK